MSYTVAELFAGCGGMALGLHKAGLECVFLNEMDSDACASLRANMPDWDKVLVEGDVSSVTFSHLRGSVDVLTGGFPCQAFSYAGQKAGLQDARGILFFEFARAIQECLPKIAIGESVKGLMTHDKGRTLATMLAVLDEIGYFVLSPQVLNAVYYNVPQRRERVFLVAVRKDVKLHVNYPKASTGVFTLTDALKKGFLYSSDVPVSAGSSYSAKRASILRHVPPGGNWRDLPINIQLDYVPDSEGGQTGVARRVAWDEPCPTLVCSPSQKFTERCHPDEERPFTVREYARIQTFPDEWSFCGSLSSQYKQIGNAVPVNLAFHMGLAVIDALNSEDNPDNPKNHFFAHQLQLFDF